MKFGVVALELLEYKLKDLEGGREVRGGPGSVWELYTHLLQDTSLGDGERKRVGAAGDKLRSLSETPQKPKGVLETLESLIIEDFSLEPSPKKTVTPVYDEPPPVLDMDLEVLEEQTVLQRLAKRVWWSEMDGVIGELAVRSRAERERTTARLLFAVVRNLERYLKTPEGAADIPLARFHVVDAVPERDDPLISLNDLESLAALIRDLIETVMALGEGTGPYKTVDMPKGQALGFVKRLALAVARDPYAGKLAGTPQRGPSSDSLRLAIQEVAKEPMREEQRRAQKQALKERLRMTTAYERQQRETFQQDVQRFTTAVHVFFDHLERYLPARVGGEAGDPQLHGGILFAVNPALRIEMVARDASAVTVRLKGPTRFTLGGLELAITGSARAQSLFIGGQEYPLQPRLKISTGRHAVVAVQEGQYLYLNVVDEARSLAALSAEALCVLFVLSSPRKGELLRVLRAAANVVVGEPRDIVVQAIDRLREVSGRAPDRRRALEGLLTGAARGIGVSLPEGLIPELGGRLHTAMTVSADAAQQVLASAKNAQTTVHTLSDEPLSLSIEGQPVTVRKYRGRAEVAQESVVVMLPGQVVGSFTNYLVQPFPGGTLVCVRADKQLACLYFAGVNVEA